MQHSFVFGLDGGRVVKHLHLCLKGSHWLRLFLVVDDHHASPYVLPHQFLVGLGGFQAQTGKLATVGLVPGYTVHMDRLHHHILEVL